MPLSVVLPDHKRLKGVELSKESRTGSALNWSVGATGFAVASGGGVYGRLDRPDPEIRHVMVAIGRDLKAARQTVIDLRRDGRAVVLTAAEPGAWWYHSVLRDPSALKLLQECGIRASGALTFSADGENFWRSAGIPVSELMPSPLPVGSDEEAPVSEPSEGRWGVFLGTMSWDNPLERHGEALYAIRDLCGQLQEPLTVVNADGWRGRRRLRQMKFARGMLRVVEKVPDFAGLRDLISKHKAVFQLDTNRGWGRVGAAAFLAGVPCMGGQGMLEQILFPDDWSKDLTADQMWYRMSHILDHPHERDEMLTKAGNAARRHLAMDVVADKVEGFLHSVY